MMNKVAIDKFTCTGCGLCSLICPKNCISMEDDQYGFTYPVIDKTKCIDCKLCEKRCPQNISLKNNTSTSIYAVRTKNNKKYKESTSGGAFSLICNATKSLYGNNLYICGAEWDSNLYVKHSIKKASDDISGFSKSKYIQSNCSVTYKLIKDLLEKDKFVLFSGTPCQVDALKLFLGKEYNNLITVDLICHGVSSRKILNDYLKFQFKDKFSNIKGYQFRTKSCLDKFPYLSTTYFKNNSKTMIRMDRFNMLFTESTIIRPSCNGRCKYQNPNRQSDITISDAKGIDKHLTHNKLFSNIIINSKKGKLIFENLRPYYSLPYSFDMLKKFNTHFFYPSQIKDNSAFYSKYDNDPSDAINTFSSNVVIINLKNFIVFRIKKVFKSLIKHA